MQTVTRLVYTSRFSTTTLVAAGIALALVVGVTVWFEARSARKWMIAPLLVLRLTAVAVVLWMLSEPTMQTEVRREHRKAVCVLVDDSASMSVSDGLPEGRPDADVVRWASPDHASGAMDVMGGLDGAAGLLAAAAKDLDRLESLWPIAKQQERAVAAANHVEQLVKAAGNRLDEVAVDRAAAGLVPIEDLSAVRDVLSSSAADEAGELRLLARRRAGGPDEGALARIADLRRLLAAEIARVNRLADATGEKIVQQASPATVDRFRADSQRSRRNKVGEWVRRAQQDWLGAIEQRARVMRYRFDAGVFSASAADLARADSADAERALRGTDLAGVIRQVALDAAGESLQAVVLLTDGGHNLDDDPLDAVEATSGPPLYVVPIGSSRPLRDVILHHVQGPRNVFKNDLIVIEAMVDAHGYNGEELAVDLLRDEQVLDTRRIKVSSDSYAGRMSFPHKAEATGTLSFRMRVRLMPEEKVRDNNEADLVVEVADDKVRTLVVDRLPRWEFRYLRNLFKRDPHMEYEDVLLESEQGGGRPALPKDVEEWSRFRVVILGDVGPNDLTPDRQESLTRFVEERGGTLIVIAGDEAMPAAYVGTAMERLLPVEASNGQEVGPDGYGLLVTAEGRSLSAVQLSEDPLVDERIWREQVTVYRISEYAKPKPSAHVLIGCMPRVGGERANRSMPAFLCWQYCGRGRVVYLSAPATYRLRQWTGDTFHHRFWGQLLRWTLAKETSGGSRTCRLGTDKSGYQENEEVRALLRLTDLSSKPVSAAKVGVAARQDDREIARVEMVEDEQTPGVYKGVFENLPVGEVTLIADGGPVRDLLASEGAIGPVETRVRIEPNVARELRNTRCNLPLLKQLADATGGLLLPPTAVKATMSQLDLDPRATSTVSEQPRWTQWKYLWLFVACLGAEWALRKGTGMA